EWACAAWLLAALADVHFSVRGHLVAPLIIYAANRVIVAIPPHLGAARIFRRIYTGVAFTSMFGSVVLLLVALLWGVARAGLEVVDIATGGPTPTAALATAAHTLATAGLLAVTSAVAYGYGIGQRKLWVNAFDVAVNGLDSAFDGVRIVQISDIHLGPY